MSKRTTKKRYTEDEEDEIFQDVSREHGNNLLKTVTFKLSPKTPNQKKFLDLVRKNDITICSGAPGSGKTFLSCGIALDILKSDPKIKKIVLVKSVTTLKSEEIGFLKGSIDEKLSPFMYSFYHNFEKLIGKKSLESLKAGGYIEELPIAYMRGINIDNAIVIIDETQNIILDNMRTIMTRLGENSKMIFLGDVEQIDLKSKETSSLSTIIKYFEKSDEYIGAISFTEEDIVRHRLVQLIEETFRQIKEDKK